VVHRLIGSPNAGQLGFSHIDGSPGASGGRALTPHAGQIGEMSSSSVSSHRSLIASVSLVASLVDKIRVATVRARS